jgi:hypothetical protein
MGIRGLRRRRRGSSQEVLQQVAELGDPTPLGCLGLELRHQEALDCGVDGEADGLGEGIP